MSTKKHNATTTDAPAEPAAVESETAKPVEAAPIAAVHNAMSSTSSESMSDEEYLRKKLTT